MFVIATRRPLSNDADFIAGLEPKYRLFKRGLFELRGKSRLAVEGAQDVAADRAGGVAVAGVGDGECEGVEELLRLRHSSECRGSRKVTQDNSTVHHGRLGFARCDCKTSKRIKVSANQRPGEVKK